MDASQLNPPQKYGLEGGRYLDAMPVLIEKGFHPLSTARVMKVMLEVHETKDQDLREHLVNGWHDDYKDTLTGNRKFGDRIRILPEDPLLVGVTSQSQLNANGSLPIPSDQFDEGDGHELSYIELVKAGIDKPLEKDGVCKVDKSGRVRYAHPGWLAYADGDKHLLRNFRDMVYSEGKRRFGYDKMMGLYIWNEAGPSVRPVILDGFDSGSSAVDLRHLDVADAQLVGVRQSASEASARPLSKGLEAKVR